TLVSSSAIIAGAFGILIAGALISVFSWHSIYVVTTVLALAVAAFVAAVVPRDRASDLAETRRIDVLGAVLFGLGIGSALYAVTASADRGWTDWQVLGFGLAGFVVLAIFVRHEVTISYLLFEFRLLCCEKVRASMIVSIIPGSDTPRIRTMHCYTKWHALAHRQRSLNGVRIGFSPLAIDVWSVAFCAAALLLAQTS